MALAWFTNTKENGHYLNKARGIYSALLVALSLSGAGYAMPAEAGVALGATRVIYPSDSKQVSLPVTNNDKSSTFLIQSWIDNEQDKRDNRFVLTPPLFVMKGEKENTLRIIDATNGSLPKDRESLFWINVKAIPSLDRSKMKDNTLQLAIVSRIKLFYRPKGLELAPEKAPEQLRFSKMGNVLTIENPTPYYLTLSSLKAGDKQLKNTMVSPKGSATVDIPNGSGSEITYQIINDFGAQSPVMKGVIK